MADLTAGLDTAQIAFHSGAESFTNAMSDFSSGDTADGLSNLLFGDEIDLIGVPEVLVGAVDGSLGGSGDTPKR